MRVFYIIIIFTFQFNFAQTNRFIYELKYRSNTQEDPKSTFMVLDINPQDVKYYNHEFLVKDSINKATNSQNLNWNDEIVPITRKKNSTKNTNYIYVGDQFYSYISNDIIKWELEKDIKKYHGFNTQKATANFGGRKWTAWFTKDIPISEGPYKFYGLPGLVILLEDSKHDYAFSLVRSYNLSSTYDTSNILEVRYGNKALPTTEKNVAKKAMEYYNDPMNEIRQGLNSGKVTSFEYYGVKYKAEELGKLVKEEQEDIISNYNPIELDKAFPYPKK